MFSHFGAIISGNTQERSAYLHKCFSVLFLGRYFVFCPSEPGYKIRTLLQLQWKNKTNVTSSNSFRLLLRLLLLLTLSHIGIPVSPSSSSSGQSLFSSWQQMLQRERTLESQRWRLSHVWQGEECLMSRETGWLRSCSLRAGTNRVKSKSKSAPLA